MMEQPREGQRAVNPTTGESAVYTNGQWVKSASQAPEASLRGRLGMGLGPMVQAQQNMQAAEQQGNPLNRDWGAALVDKIPGADAIAKAWGGQDYQSYVQAAKTFESQVMPIMSGAAVSPSEAQRQVRAALPELGDSPETLARKAEVRAMMINGGAKLMGANLPYPQVNTYGVNSQTVPQAQAPQGGGQQQRRLSPQEAAQLPRGTRFIGQDGVERVRQ